MSLYTNVCIWCSIYITETIKGSSLINQIVSGNGREKKNCLQGMKRPSVIEET